MRNRLVIALFVVMAAAVSNTCSAQSLQYDPATGNVKFQGLANVGGLRLVGPGVPAVTPADLGGFADTSIPGEVSWLFFASKNGDLDAGNLFPKDLFKVNLQIDSPTQQYEAYYVVTGGGGAQVELPILGGLEIPEPASIAMAGLGLIGCVAARRRLVI